jgi:hypothetical protein
MPVLRLNSASYWLESLRYMKTATMSFSQASSSSPSLIVRSTVPGTYGPLGGAPFAYFSRGIKAVANINLSYV